MNLSWYTCENIWKNTYTHTSKLVCMWHAESLTIHKSSRNLALRHRSAINLSNDIYWHLLNVIIHQHRNDSSLNKRGAKGAFFAVISRAFKQYFIDRVACSDSNDINGWKWSARAYLELNDWSLPVHVGAAR